MIEHDAAAALAAGWPRDDWWTPQRVELPSGSGLAVRVHQGSKRPVMLIHGLASNALLWRDVADTLADRGHALAVVDLRSHGRSEQTSDGHDTRQAAADVSWIAQSLGWRDETPVLVGQSWGGNVALQALADGAFAGAVCVDGGWIHLQPRFASFDECWKALAPPGFGALTPDQVLARLTEVFRDWPPHALPAVLGNLRVQGTRVSNRLPLDQHRAIVHSLWRDPPAEAYRRIVAPVHLLVAGRSSSSDVDAALAAMPSATVSWHPAAPHDIHLQQPQIVTDQVGELLGRVERSVG